MSTYATVPEVGEQSSKPSTLGFKKVVAGALFAAFLLGSLAAVVVAGGWDNGYCIGVRANLHVGKLVERFDCSWDEDHHVYSNWHME